MNNILLPLLLTICLLFNACTKKETDFSNNYPIVLEDTIRFTQSNSSYEIDLDNDGETDIEIEQFSFAGMGGVKKSLYTNVIDSFWKVGTIEKTHFICYDTLDYLEMEFYEKQSCNDTDTYTENESYSAVMLIKEEELSSTNSIKFLHGQPLIYYYYSYKGIPFRDYYGNITGSHYKIEKSVFTDQDHGYFIFENNSGLRLKMSTVFLGHGLRLKQIDILE